MNCLLKKKDLKQLIEVTFYPEKTLILLIYL